MRKRVPIKNHTEEIKLVSHRCLTLCVIMAILMMLLVARLGWLQISRHNLFTTLSQKNWLDLVPVDPTRGLIYDRNGVLLAENIPVFSLDVIRDKVNNLPAAINAIRKFIDIDDNDLAQFHRQLYQHRRFDEVTLKLRLTASEVARFAENQYRFPGIFVHAHLIRFYPFGAAFSHVLGYVGRINIKELRSVDPINYSATNYIGKSGIEKFYENILHGTVGYEQAESNANGETIRTLKKIPATSGKDLWLTLDSKLQLATEKAFASRRGAAIVIDPNTGEVLAMVSTPGFDPNAFVTGISRKDYHALQQSSDQPLYDRALHGLYPPGSTIKPFLAIGALNDGVTTPEETIHDHGVFTLPNSKHVFHDWDWWRGGHGLVNLARSIIVSCDVYYFQLSQKLGIARIDAIMQMFGFGQATGIDLLQERAGIIASPDYKWRARHEAWYKGDTVISAIGQGFMQVTLLQLAYGVAAIAMRGDRHMPHLLRYTADPNQPRIAWQVASVNPITLQDNNAWQIVRDAMQRVMTSKEGTGAVHFGLTSAYTVAGKTGTAQVHNIRQHVHRENQAALPERLRDNSLFIGYAPVDHPRIAFAVIAQNDSDAPKIARDIVDAYMGILPLASPQSSTGAAPDRVNPVNHP